MRLEEDAPVRQELPWGFGVSRCDREKKTGTVFKLIQDKHGPGLGGWVIWPR